MLLCSIVRDLVISIREAREHGMPQAERLAVHTLRRVLAMRHGYGW